jgi:hypothetical protein
MLHPRNTFRIIGPLRGDYLLVKIDDTTTEVLYRSHMNTQAVSVLSAADKAWARGRRQRNLGWPWFMPERSPMFATQPNGGAGWWVVERHPRLSLGDRILYATPSKVDADLALKAIRRAATIGCTTTD